ncbi:hypothetical protein ASPBRDRAFT_205022 [Aspergillus brasiliensis CBS 101740]|uniref:NAD-dependent epimerase/dehydratase domain-containing protein n=1 Tax=Aspergillus brasiliensis (strain CBS 101740 / IMI 381727 / IBT 21946) TaxID=767769 RepID=A0A1L9UTP8_ASPBC|nr:hypothetical protein ASPBRDRAFT_205022 [Aspergillus brasiliensis CBS 101740]
MAPMKILLLGATGFVGGSVLHELLDLRDEQNAGFQITVAVRRQDQAEILSKRGLRTILIAGLDDDAALEDSARDHDIVVNAATGQHSGAPKALIRGLGKRREQNGQDTHFIHLSGTTNIAVPTITPSPYKLQCFSDEDDNIYEYEKRRIMQEPYGQRVADVVVIEAGEKFDVKPYIIMPPTVYGTGTGLFKRQSHQIPTVIRSALKSGYAEYIGTGQAKLGHVHVTDLARLFGLLAAKIVTGEAVSSGKQGYYFANTGSYKWIDAATLIGEAGFDSGLLKSPIPRSISLEEGAQKFADGDVAFAEACFASNSISVPQRAFKLGWKPLHKEEDFKASIKSTLKEINDEGF